MPGDSLTWRQRTDASGAVVFDQISTAPGLTVTLEAVATEHGPEVRRIEVVADEGHITAGRLTTIPVRVLARGALTRTSGSRMTPERVARHLYGDALRPLTAQLKETGRQFLERTGHARRGRPMKRPYGGSREFDQQVLDVFAHGEQVGTGGVEAVKEVWGVHYNTAARWLRDARRRRDERETDDEGVER